MKIALIGYGEMGRLIRRLAEVLGLPFVGAPSRFEALAARALVGRAFPVGHFWSLLQAAGMTPDELFTAYVGKNVLNFFRQDHGYKDGSYRKTWQGREDNEHLAELLGQLDSRSPRYADELYGALAARYAQVAAAHA